MQLLFIIRTQQVVWRVGIKVLSMLLIMFCHAAVAADNASPLKLFQHFKDCDMCSEMVVLPAGQYMMGATDADFKGNEQYRFMLDTETPRHLVHVKSFAIAKFDVTRAQFAQFVRETGFKDKGCEIFGDVLGTPRWYKSSLADWQNPGFKQTGQDPVVCVSWNDAQKYIAWLNVKLGNKSTGHYRLPTEAEWEYAARAGAQTPNYWGGVGSANQCKFANARDLSAKDLDPGAPHVNCFDGYIETSPVGSFQPNAWGLYDMLGNVQQWVMDCMQYDYSAASAAIMLNTENCTKKDIRGAGWATIPIGVRSACRNASKPNARNTDFSFRLAVDINQQNQEMNHE